MTVERLKLPDLTNDENDLVYSLLKQLSARKDRNLLRASYYDGRRAIRQVGTVIPPQYYRLGLVLGWSAKAVDILARRCNLDGFVWPDGDLGDIGLGEVVDGNFLLAEVSAALVSSLIHGVVFAVNTTGGADEPASLVHFKDALNATGEWNWRTRSMDNLLSITARDSDGNPTALALYLDGDTVTAEKDGAKWSTDRSPHKWGVPVEAMVYKPRIGRPFGSSRISRAVMSHHDEALRTVIRMEAHMDVFSFPDMWMLGADSSIFKNEDGSMKPSWQVMLGRIKGIPDDDEAPESLARASIQQFQAASPQPHLDALKMQAQLFCGETNIPLTSLGVSDMSNPTSADSYIASREDLIADAEGATDDWAPPLRRTIVRALAIQNGTKAAPATWATIEPKWRSPLYLSRAAQADAGGKQIAAAPWLADTDVGLELLGLDEQQIRRAMAAKRVASASSLVDKLFAAPVPPPPANAVQQATAATNGNSGT